MAEFLTSSPVTASRIKSKQVESGKSRGWSHDWLNDQPPKGSNPKLVGFSLLLGGVPSTLVLVSLKFSLKKKPKTIGKMMTSNIRHKWVAGGKLLYWRIKPGPQRSERQER